MGMLCTSARATHLMAYNLRLASMYSAKLIVSPGDTKRRYLVSHLLVLS